MTDARWLAGLRRRFARFRASLVVMVWVESDRERGDPGSGVIPAVAGIQAPRLRGGRPRAPVFAKLGTNSLEQEDMKGGHVEIGDTYVMDRQGLSFDGICVEGILLVDAVLVFGEQHLGGVGLAINVDDKALLADARHTGSDGDGGTGLPCSTFL